MSLKVLFGNKLSGNVFENIIWKYDPRLHIVVGSNVPPDIKQNVEFFFKKKNEGFLEISEDDIFVTIWS